MTVFRPLEWKIGRGYRKATGIACQYGVYKNHKAKGYSLHCKPIGSFYSGEFLGTDFTSYDKAIKAANTHNQSILSQWIQLEEAQQ